MKIAALVSRLLLGVAFLVFGLNGFLNFIPEKGMPTGLPGQFIGAMAASHYLMGVCAVQAVAALLLLVNRYVPLALVMLAPVLVNILFYHFFFNDLPGIVPGAICVVLWFVVALRHRPAFAGLLQK